MVEVEVDTLPTRYLRSRKRGRASPTKATPARKTPIGLLRPRKTLGARADDDGNDTKGAHVMRPRERRRRRRKKEEEEEEEDDDLCVEESEGGGARLNGGRGIEERPGDVRARFDAANARQVADAKAVLSPCASGVSTSSSSSMAAAFGIRSGEASAVLRAVGVGDKCYVCGLPGTGKTHTTTRIAAHLAQRANMQVVAVNCMHLARCGNLDDEKAIFDALIEAVESGRPGSVGSVATPYPVDTSTRSTVGGTTARRAGGGVGGEVELRRILSRPPRRVHTVTLDASTSTGSDGHGEERRVRVRRRGDGIVIMLDEMDALDARARAPLLALPCAVIGIANSITLVERLAASGATGEGSKPVTVAFAPYTQADLARILDARLAALPFDLMHPAAVKLVTTRVAAHSGDVRRLLGAVSAAVDVAAADAADAADSGGVAAGGGPVTIVHMSKALHSLMASQTVKAIAALSTYQQIALCAGVRLSEGATVGELFSSCRGLCESHLRVPRIEYAAFCSVLSTLTEMSMLHVTGAACASVGIGSRRGGGGPRRGFGGAKRAHASPAADRGARVLLRVTRDDVRFALGGVSFFAALLAE